MNLLKELYNNKDMVISLSKNDFKTKYAGSYLGIFWAFVQPIITIILYWFVFQVGFKSAPVDDFPFILWLITGLVPWFFFSDALLNATNSFIEYSYLVKKVVFKISILPFVKVISSLFVHTFFISLTLIIYVFYKRIPSLHAVQILYYSFCAFCFTLSISYITSAIIPFFKDFSQIVNIFLQIGMWLTPIMWSYEMISPKYRWILDLNPMFYICNGYRNALIEKTWFFKENLGVTIYFWIVTILLFLVGVLLFKKLKPHFSDVL